MSDQPPTTDEAVLVIVFTEPGVNFPGRFLDNELDAIEVTWDELPADVAAGRYEIEGTTSVLVRLLEEATQADAVVSHRWAPVPE